MTIGYIYNGFDLIYILTNFCSEFTVKCPQFVSTCLYLLLNALNDDYCMTAFVGAIIQNIISWISLLIKCLCYRPNYSIIT